ncbi:response regulator transcription factor [Conexibacter sp. JD483]|uniref:LuxR C-terminal-related transcriptional regulator n=1 Tax=unclassified Conexibacter TaxID=2627773 RepID=UPI002717FE22|nr:MULTISPECIES: response regulator transcription factor [unclassified Conexibacter]MDO8185619.1 response regulator transcription factor [Conexibacter sp. CPCC 205706]MDO8198792.1 response regulator transcription factor [Conexibacter sp. CPCC 205762]MDR9367858.1 response regulator transcription factor [Conexibacter sp. JD483]
MSRLAAIHTAAPAIAEPISLALADDSFLVREAVAHVLAASDGVEVVAVCRDRAALLAAVARERPAVVVTGSLPSSRERPQPIAEELRRRHPAIGVVELSGSGEPRFGVELLADGSGGRAFLLKERLQDSRQLLAAIEVVAHGGAYVDACVIERMRAARRRADNSPLAELSPREREVLAQIATGKSNACIAAELVLTKRAVEKHINAIFLKLGLSYETDVSRRVMATLIHQAATRELP